MKFLLPKIYCLEELHYRYKNKYKSDSTRLFFTTKLKFDIGQIFKQKFKYVNMDSQLLCLQPIYINITYLKLKYN